jgi:hypothetical protein
VDLIPSVVHSRAVWRRDMPKTRFVIRVPGKTDIGCDTAEQVLDALTNLKNAKGVTVADLQTGMNELSQEALEELANEERE